MVSTISNNISQTAINCSSISLSNVAGIGINTTALGNPPSSVNTKLLTIAASVSATNPVFWIDSGGNIMTLGDITAFATTSSLSDRRLKDNIAVLHNVMCLEQVNAIKPVSFTWCSNQLTGAYAGRDDIGMIAQDLEAIVPQAVSDRNILDHGEYKTVKYEKLVPILIGAIQRLTSRVAELEQSRCNP
jgi:hypothetical protein